MQNLPPAPGAAVAPLVPPIVPVAPPVPLVVPPVPPVVPPVVDAAAAAPAIVAADEARQVILLDLELL